MQPAGRARGAGGQRADVAGVRPCKHTMWCDSRWLNYAVDADAANWLAPAASWLFARHWHRVSRISITSLGFELPALLQVTGKHSRRSANCHSNGITSSCMVWLQLSLWKYDINWAAPRYISGKPIQLALYAGIIWRTRHWASIAMFHQFFCASLLKERYKFLSEDVLNQFKFI